MNFRQLSSRDLATFTANIETVLAGGDITSMRPDLRDLLLAELGELPSQLATLSEEVVAAEAARQAKVAERNEVRARVRLAVARVRNTLKASGASAAEYELCGFTKPVRRRTYPAQDPTEASVTGTSNGVNRLKFSGNNRASQVVYQIWRRPDKRSRWSIHALTRRQTFIDIGVVPGRNYEYKIKAVAAKTASNFSNIAFLS